VKWKGSSWSVERVVNACEQLHNPRDEWISFSGYCLTTFIDTEKVAERNHKSQKHFSWAHQHKYMRAREI